MTTTLYELDAPFTLDKRHEFESLFARSRRQAYNLAYRMTGNREDAEDLTQDAYLRAYRSFHTFNYAFKFETWLFRILSNLFIDRLRRKSKLATFSISQTVGQNGDEHDLMWDIPDEESNPETQMMRQQVDERLQKALAALPKEFRTAVLLCDVEELTYEEIAQAMGTSVGTVRSRIHRARKHMMKSILGCRRDQGLLPASDAG